MDLEDNQELLKSTPESITAEEEVNETENPVVAGGPAITLTEAGVVLTRVKVEAEIDMDSAAEDFQETLLTQEVIEDENDDYVDEDIKDMREIKMEVDHVHVTENDLDGAAFPLFNGDHTTSMTVPIFPSNTVEVESSFINEEAEVSSEETISSYSVTSPTELFETNGKSGNPNLRMSINSKSGPEKTLQVNELEDQVKELRDLLILKEKEWNVILRLKKHTECVLEQAKFGQRTAKAQTGFDEKVPMTEDDKKTWISLITSNRIGTLENAKKKIKDSTHKLESRFITMEAAFPFLGSLTSTPRSSRQGRDSIRNGETNSVVASTSKPKVDSGRKVMMKPNFKPAPKLPVSKSLASSPATSSQGQRMSGRADLRPFIRTLRNIAASKNKLNTAFKPVRMTGADRRFRYQKVIDKLKVEANKLRKAANSGNHARPPVQQSVKNKSKSSKQPIVTKQPASGSGERSVVVTFSTGEKDLVTQQNYRKQTPFQAPICQGCHAAPSEYMCSICKDQWYCSRECQLNDWGEHSEFCSSEN